jgi:hypothetical protein
MQVKVQVRPTNVIAFPRFQRDHAMMRCDDTKSAAICSYCGGRLAKGESEDDCSSRRISKVIVKV